MRYDNIFWVLIAPGLASCACFAFEVSYNFAESWNNRFEELRRGFEVLGGAAKPKDTHLSFQQPLGTDSAENGRFSCGTKEQPLNGIRVLASAMLFGMHPPSSG